MTLGGTAQVSVSMTLYDLCWHWHRSSQVNPWLPDSDTIQHQLIDRFQLAKSTWNIKSTVNKLIPKHFCHVFLYSSSRRTLKFTFNQTFISRDFSILFRFPWLSIPQTENSLSTRACDCEAKCCQTFTSAIFQLSSRMCNWTLKKRSNGVLFSFHACVAVLA